MKTFKKVIVVIVAIILLIFLFIYRSYNLKKLDEAKNVSTQNPKNTIECVDEYKPVCGEDKMTYSNECVATKINEVKIAYAGKCKEETKNLSETGAENIGESNLGETTDTGSVEKSNEVVNVIEKIEKPSADYYKNLKSQCGNDTCCLSSVDNMESGGYSEAIDAKCKKGYITNTLKCEGSYTWCEIDENPVTSIPETTPVTPKFASGASSTGATGIVNGQKVLNYFNSSYSYGFSVPSNTYFSGYGPQGGANHAVGITTSSGATTYGDSKVKVLIYKGKILPELQDSSYGMYTDKSTGMIYIALNGSSVVIDSGKGNDKIVDMILKTIYVK